MLADRGGGQVTRCELVAGGMTDNQIALRVQRGQLIRRRRGVFGVGCRDRSDSSRLHTALLAIGVDAVGSHLAAASTYGFWRSLPGVVDVTCRRWLPNRGGIRLHHRELDPDEISDVDGLPLTSPTRTLFDLGTMLGAAAHAKAANEAFVKRLLTITDLRAARHRYARRKGSSAFERLLATLDPEGREVRSPLETRLNAFLRARGFPSWESNAVLVVGGERIRPDVLWRPQRVSVEADGRDPHLAPLTFDSDRRRDPSPGGHRGAPRWSAGAGRSR